MWKMLSCWAFFLFFIQVDTFCFCFFLYAILKLVGHSFPKKKKSKPSYKTNGKTFPLSLWIFSLLSNLYVKTFVFWSRVLRNFSPKLFLHLLTNSPCVSLHYIRQQKREQYVIRLFRLDNIYVIKGLYVMERTFRYLRN